MPTLKTFLVRLKPVECARFPDGAFSVELPSRAGTPIQEHTVSVRTLPDLSVRIEELARHFNGPCSATVQCLDTRKPAGFGAYSAVARFFNFPDRGRASR